MKKKKAVPKKRAGRPSGRINFKKLISMHPDTWAKLERLRGKKNRSRYVSDLIKKQKED